MDDSGPGVRPRGPTPKVSTETSHHVVRWPAVRCTARVQRHTRCRGERTIRASRGKPRLHYACGLFSRRAVTTVLLLHNTEPGRPDLAADFQAAGFTVCGQGDCAHLVRETLRAA